MTKKGQLEVFEKLIKKAANSGMKIVLPESSDQRVLHAAAMAAETGIAKIILLGRQENFKGVFSKKAQKEIFFIDEKASENKKKLSESLYELRKHKGLSLTDAEKLVSDKLYFSTMLVKTGFADGMVAGATCRTDQVLRPAFQIIKPAAGNSLASGFFAIQVDKNIPYGENGILIFADCGVVENPTKEQLAEIAIQSAKSAQTIFGMDPKVALLSYSTKFEGDKVSESIAKVKDAFLLVRRLDSSLKVDGELQVDAALDPEIAKMKAPKSKVAGQANVLIFPDLNSGNIAYKIAQKLSNSIAIGPIIQGLSKPVNDVSRGAVSEEIFLSIAITAIMAKNVANTKT